MSDNFTKSDLMMIWAIEINIARAPSSGSKRASTVSRFESALTYLSTWMNVCSSFWTRRVSCLIYTPCVNQSCKHETTEWICPVKVYYWIIHRDIYKSKIHSCKFWSVFFYFLINTIVLKIKFSDKKKFFYKYSFWGPLNKPGGNYKMFVCMSQTCSSF